MSLCNKCARLKVVGSTRTCTALGEFENYELAVFSCSDFIPKRRWVTKPRVRLSIYPEAHRQIEGGERH